MPKFPSGHLGMTGGFFSVPSFMLLRNAGNASSEYLPIASGRAAVKNDHLKRCTDRKKSAGKA